MQLDQLYKSILESLGLQVDPDNSMVSMVLANEKFPCTCIDKRLVLPTQEVLRNPRWNETVAFHPICENVIKGESPILKKYRALIAYRLTEVISGTMLVLMNIAVNRDLHSRLTPAQSEFLSLVADADAKTYEALESVIGAIDPETTDRRLVSIYQKRGGMFNGERYSRVAVTSFPIYDEFDEPEATIFGVKMRKKDKAAIAALFNYIIPNADSEVEYSYASNDMTAPYFHSLTKAYARVARRLNAVVRKFKKHITNHEGFTINIDWEDELDALAKYRDVIPVLEGNDGELGAEPAKTSAAGRPQVAPHMAKLASAAAGQATPTPAPTATVTRTYAGADPATVAQPQQPASTGKGLDWHELKRANPNLVPGQQMPQYGQQPYGHPYPGHYQPPVMVQPGDYAGYNRGAPVAIHSHYSGNYQFDPRMNRGYVAPAPAPAPVGHRVAGYDPRNAPRTGQRRYP